MKTVSVLLKWRILTLLGIVPPPLLLPPLLLPPSLPLSLSPRPEWESLPLPDRPFIACVGRICLTLEATEKRPFASPCGERMHPW